MCIVGHSSKKCREHCMPHPSDRVIFGRVEEAFGDMDSRVESMGTSLQQLCNQHEEQTQCAQATLQMATALEQRLL